MLRLLLLPFCSCVILFFFLRKKTALQSCFMLRGASEFKSAGAKKKRKKKHGGMLMQLFFMKQTCVLDVALQHVVRYVSCLRKEELQFQSGYYGDLRRRTQRERGWGEEGLRQRLGNRRGSLCVFHREQRKAPSADPQLIGETHIKPGLI